MAVKTAPKLVLQGGVESAPTLRLRQVLPRRHPDLFQHDPGPTYAALLLVPRCTEGHLGDCGRHVGPGRWYELRHAYEKMAPDPWWAGGADEDVQMPTWEYASPVAAYLPAPAMLSVEERLAGLPPIQVSEREIAFFGSYEEAYQAASVQRRVAVEQDRSAAARDWEATADTFAETIRMIGAIKLDAAQRAAQADVRVFHAYHEVEQARRSRSALRRNAGLEPLGEDLHGDPGELVWFVVPQERAALPALSPEEHGIEVPEHIDVWAQAKAEAWDRGDTDTYLQVTTPEYAHRVHGEIFRTTAAATAKEMYPIRRALETSFF